jgi:WD40 repeat protein
MELCPYKGLLPYREQDARYFFGRDIERRLIRDNLRASRLTILYGTSGTGKSSVLGAGVAHDLKDDPDYLLLYFGTPGTWRNDPVSSLNAAVEEKISHLPGYEPNGGTAPNQGLFRGLESRLAAVDRTLLVILDQFEEYFQYHPNEDGENTFAVEFPRILRQEQIPVHFLLSVREDAIATLDRFKKRIPALFNNRLRVEFLSRDAALDAVIKPIDVFNQEAHAFGTVSIREEVAEHVVDKIISAQKGEKRCVQTPYLQLVLERWWNREIDSSSHELREKTLQDLGGVETIVDRHLELTLSQLSPDGTEAAAEIFRFMVTPGGRKIALTVSELAGNISTQVSESIDIKALLEKLREARVLTTVPPPQGSAPGEQCYEFAHDVIARAALEWRRHFRDAQKLAEANEREKTAKFRAESQQRLAEERKRQTIRLRKWAFSLAVLLAIALGSIAYAGFEFFQAKWEYNQRMKMEQAARVPNLLLHSMRVSSQDPELSVLLAMHAVVLAWSDKTRKDFSEAEKQLRQSVLNSHVQTTLAGHQGPVNGVRWSPDGQFLATIGDDGTVRIWSAKTHEQLKVFKAPGGPINAVAWKSDASLLAVGANDGTLTVWNTSSWTQSWRSSANGVAINDLSWNPRDKNQLLKANANGLVALLNGETGDPLKSFQADQGEIRSVAWSPDGLRIAAGTQNDRNSVKVWDARTDNTLWSGSGDVWETNGVSWSPDGRFLATGGEEGVAVIWDGNGGEAHGGKARDGKVLFRLRGHRSALGGVSWSSDGRHLATASADGTARVWDAKTGEELMTLAGHHDWVNDTAWNPDARHLATASRDGTAKIWDTGANEPLTLSGHSDRVSSVDWSPDGTRLASSSNDKTARIWDTVTGKPLLTLEGHSDWVNDISWNPDGKRIATASGDKTVKIWDSQAGKALQTFPSNDSGWMRVAWSPNGGRLAAGAGDGSIVIWDAEGKNPPRHLVDSKHAFVVLALAWNPDGNKILTASGGRTVIWNAETGAMLYTLTDDDSNQSISDAQWSKDGTHLATASSLGSVVIWDASTYKALGTVPGLLGRATSVAWSPRGKKLAIGSNDWTAMIWDLQVKTQLLTFPGHASAVTRLAWSPDAKRLATATQDGTILIHTVSVRELMTLASKRVARTLSPDECRYYLKSTSCPTPSLPPQ